MTKKMCIRHVHLAPVNERKTPYDIVINDHNIRLYLTGEFLDFQDTSIFDADKCIALPSFIDMQVHLRAPGQEEKEDLCSGTQAAAKGGYTHVACMPNTRPVLDNAEYIRWIQQEVQQGSTYSHIYPIAAMTEHLAGKKIADYDLFRSLGVIAITDDGFGVQDDSLMEKIFIHAKEKKLILMQHCEYEYLSHKRSFHEGVFTDRHHFAGYPSSAEFRMIERDLKLVERYQVPYHVLHLSTKEGVELVRQAKAKGLPVTCEVTPHHLLLCDEDIQEPFANYKMNPPLRGADDRQALQKGLADGTIDIISTDHAPHTREEKERPHDLAPFGIIGLEFAWPLLYTELYLKHIVSFSRLLDAFSIKARSIFGLPQYPIANGVKAHLTLIAPEYSKVASVNELCSKSMNTPFLGRELKGWPVLTIWDGRITYKDEIFWRKQYVSHNKS